MSDIPPYVRGPKSHMLGRLLSCIVAGLIVVSLDAPIVSAESYVPPDSDQWVKIEPAKKLNAFRAFVAPLVHADTVRARIEGPAAGVDHVASIVIKDARGKQVAKSTVKMQAQRGRPSREHPQGKVESVQCVASIDVSKLDDGQYTAAIEVDWEKRPLSKLRTKISQPFRIVRKQLAAIDDAKQRDEVSVWITDHNLQEPIWGKIPTWTNLPKALAQGKAGDPFRDLRGFLLRSYFNPQLRRRQPYTAYIPKALDLSEPAPLLILLHGSGGDYRNLVADHAAGQRFEKHPMLIANAGAFAHQEYRHMALNDVRWVIEDMQRKYNVDADRIYCQGISLGGRGTLELAARMPDTFAAVSSQGVYGVMPDLVDPLWSSRVDRVRLDIETRKDIRTWLPNMAHVPVEMVFGYNDPTTPPVNARLIASALKQSRRGSDNAGEVIERGFDDDHNITMPNYDWATTREWFLKHKRKPATDRRTFRIDNLTYAHSGPIVVHNTIDSSRIASLGFVIDAKSRTARIAFENIRAATLQRGDAKIDTVVLADGSTHKLEAGREMLLGIREDGKPYAVAHNPDAAGAPAKPTNDHKARGFAGPIWDVWTQPVVYIYEDSGDEKTIQRLRESAEQSARIDANFGEPTLLVLPASKLTTELQRDSNVILFSTGQGKLRESIKTPWPDIGDTKERLKQSDLRIALRPAPVYIHRYVLVVDVLGDQPVNLRRVGWWDSAFHTDWLIGKIVESRGRRGLAILAAGYYDTQWKPAAFTTIDPRGPMVLR